MVSDSKEESDLDREELDKIMDALFAIFYIDNACLAARDHVFLQWAIDGVVSTFERVGLETNTTKIKVMGSSFWLIHTNGCAPGTRWLLIGMLALLPAKSAGMTRRRALLAVTLRISTRSTRGRWWLKSYLIGMRVWYTRLRRGMVSSNAHSP
jgi:hypothetical protein